MTTLAAVKYEFRCSTCYQILHASVEEAGSELECRWCQNMVLAPDATPERIAEAADAAISDDLTPGMFAAGERMSVEEIEEVARQRAKQRQAGDRSERCRNPAQSSAPRLSRLFAVIADGIVSILVGALGAITVPVASFLGILDREALAATGLFLQQLARASATGEWAGLQVPPSAYAFILTAGFPAMIFGFLQLQWICTRGQTVGKRLLGIRIVNSEGHAPGFFRGVVLRGWIPLAMSLYAVNLAGDTFFFSDMTQIGIRVLSFANIVAIFMEPPRCLHDHLAGTYVVDA